MFYLSMISFLLFVSIRVVTAGTLSLSLSPSNFPCGDSINVFYSYSGSGITFPLKLYLKGQLSVFSSAEVTLPTPSLPDQTVTFQWSPTGCESPGNWFFFIQDNAIFTISSNNAPVTIQSTGSSGFYTNLVVSPTTLSAGSSVSVLYSTFGVAANPVTLYIVGYTAYQTGSILGGWMTYPLVNSIPPAAVSSGSYYIIARTASGTWSIATPVTILLTKITVFPTTTFRVFDEVSVSWPVGSIIYPVEVYIAGVFSSVIVGVVNSGTSFTIKTNLNHVSRGSYSIYLSYSSSFGKIKTESVQVTVLPFDPNLAAVAVQSEAFLASRFAFLSYQESEAIKSWNTSNVCSLCPACAQTADVTNVWSFDSTDLSSGGDAFLIRKRDDGLFILSFEGTTVEGITDFLRDFLTDLNYVFSSYPGCLTYSSSCKVHTGFYNRYKLYKYYLRNALNEAIPQSLKATSPIMVVGHSLGAAVATIAAFELSLAGYLVIGVYTVGSPRVGNNAFVTAWSLLVGHARDEFFNAQPFSSTRSSKISINATETLKPSLLLLEAVGLPESTLALPDDIFWSIWEESSQRLTAKARKLTNYTPGAGNVNEPFRGAWRIANCQDPVLTIPSEVDEYLHVDTIIQVDDRTPLTFSFIPDASCSGSSSRGPHFEAAYLKALGGTALDISKGYVQYTSTGTPWVATGGIACASISPSRTPSGTKTPQSVTPSGSSSQGNQSATATATVTMSFSVTASITPSSSLGQSPTESMTVTVSLSSTISITSTPTPTPSVSFSRTSIQSAVSSTPASTTSVISSSTVANSPIVSQSLTSTPSSSSVVVSQTASPSVSIISLLGKDGATKSQDGGKVGLSIAEIAGISAGAGALLVACIVVVVSNMLKKRKSAQMLHARPRGQKIEKDEVNIAAASRVVIVQESEKNGSRKGRVTELARV
jgi:hypothetical protein